MFSLIRACLTCVCRDSRAGRSCRPIGPEASGCAMPQCICVPGACGAVVAAQWSRQAALMVPRAVPR